MAPVQPGLGAGIDGPDLRQRRVGGVGERHPVQEVDELRVPALRVVEVEHAEAAADERLARAEQVVGDADARRPEERLHVDPGARHGAVAPCPRHARERRVRRRGRVVGGGIEHGHALSVSFRSASEVRHPQPVFERQAGLGLPAVLRVAPRRCCRPCRGRYSGGTSSPLFSQGPGQQVREVVAARSGRPVRQNPAARSSRRSRLTVVHPFVERTGFHRVRPGDLGDVLRARRSATLGEQHRIEPARVEERRSVSPGHVMEGI